MESRKESAVRFVETEELYSFNEDLICKFIPNHYTPQDGDRVAMFKLGWKSVKDYMLFEWAPTGLPETIEHQVIFEKYNLPKNTSEIYQICYISSENVLHGATIPFQFQSEKISKRFASLSDSHDLSLSEAPLTLSSCEDILKLRRTKKENESNMHMDASITKMCKGPREIVSIQSHEDCDKQIAALKSQIEFLRKTVAIQQNEINALRCKEINVSKTPKKNQKPSFLKELNYDLGELDPIPPFPLNL